MSKLSQWWIKRNEPAVSLVASLDTHFAVIDVETTGLSPQADRVLQLAVVRVTTSGQVLDEWSAVFDPQGPVGATHIHGLTPEDVRGQPTFEARLHEISSLLAGHVLVAHNAAFDMAFVAQGFARAGWELPPVPVVCTLESSSYYLPDLERRRLIDCCTSAGVELRDAHSALGDARATAALFSTYMDPHRSPGPLLEHLQLPGAAQSVQWPTTVTRERRATTSAPSRQAWTTSRLTPPTPSPSRLTALVNGFAFQDALEAGAPTHTIAYLEFLAEVLEDGDLSPTESGALEDLVAAYDMTADEVRAAHRAFILAMSHYAFDDGRVSAEERNELTAIAALLQVDKVIIKNVLDEVDQARLARLSQGLRELPSDWSAGEPLRVGDKVVFTGGDDDQRLELETRASTLGLRVVSSVSKQTAMLVTDGQFAGSKAAKAAQLGTRLVHPADFVTLLDYLQPAKPREQQNLAPTRPRPASAPTAPPAPIPTTDRPVETPCS